MSKKHFEIIAKHISMMMDPIQRLNAAVALASACAELNPRFDTDKFFAACNVVTVA